MKKVAPFNCFLKLLAESGYMNVVMGLQIAGGVALLTIRWANLGVLILGLYYEVKKGALQWEK